MTDPKCSDEVFRAAAKRLYEDEGQVEVDDNAVVSRTGPKEGGDDGAYVAAWVWVTNEDAKKMKKELKKVPK